MTCSDAVLIYLLSLAERHYQNDAVFRKFRRELFHTSLRAILDPLRQSMTSYEVLRCADGHYRRVVFSLGPYIADYPEQVLLACTVQGWCPRYVTTAPASVYMYASYTHAHVRCHHRCTANPSELDTGQASRRSHEHTQAALDALDLRSLWDDYGIVGDLTVRCSVDGYTTSPVRPC